MKGLIKYILISLFFYIYLTVNAQNSEGQFSVELGNKKIKTTEPFTVAVTLQNFENTPTIQFPEIKGFQKRDQSTTRNYYTSGNAKAVSTQIVKQNYYAIKSGSYVLAPILISINTKSIKTESCVVEVEAIESEEVENAIIYNDNIVTNDAILVVSTDKNQVYLGEGFNMRLSLIVSESNTAEMEFYLIESQLSQILKKIKPTNCWEENFGIKDINSFPIVIAGKKYTEYRIYQASFFPINTQSITIGEVNLTMKISTGEGTKRTSKLQKYISKPLFINILPLPPHPLKSQVSVGNFRLEESVDKQKIRTGQSFAYRFKIIGEGNLSTSRGPAQDSIEVLDIYTPDVDFTTTLQNRTIIEEKSYNYTLIPKQTGEVALKNIFYWIFFNPQKQRYDTLRSTINLKVGGRDIENSEDPQVGSDLLYEGIENLDSTKREFNYQKTIKSIANVLIILMLVGMVFIFRKK